MSTENCSYLVCATQRSGSTLLCALLEGTGVAGHPREFYEALAHSGVPRTPREYFDDAASLPKGLPEPAADPPPLWDREDYGPYFDWSLREGRTPNGVFGAKLMGNYRSDLLALLRTIPRFTGLGDDGELLRTAFGDPVFVWIRRANTVEQAVSLWKAVQTAAWRGDARPAGETRYDYAALDHLVDSLRAEDEAWGAFFSRHDIQPVVLLYRDIVRQRPATMRRVLHALGLPDDGVPDEDPIERQADERSREWAQRFQIEKNRQS